MKIANLKDSLSRVRGSLNATISGKTDQVSCAFGAQRIRVCLGQNGFFWHPWVVWKLLEARLGPWAFRTCTGCKS